MSNQNAVAARPIDQLKNIMASPSVAEQFRNCMAENSNLFISSLIDLYAGDTYLQQCNPAQVVAEALKAATLKLPINKSLGFAWIIPRKKSRKVGNQWESEMQPAFQLGWKGIVQLAQRTGQYRYINCDSVLEGELLGFNKLSGEVNINGEATSEKIVGYFAYIEFMNGFSKTSYWTKAKVEAHALRYNQECKKAGKLTGNWLEHFDSRAMSTVLKHLISKYGVMSIEMADTFVREDESHDDALELDYRANANTVLLPEPPPAGVDAETGEVTVIPNGTRQQEMTSAEIDAQLAAEEEAPY